MQETDDVRQNQVNQNSSTEETEQKPKDLNTQAQKNRSKEIRQRQVSACYSVAIENVGRPALQALLLRGKACWQCVRGNCVIVLISIHLKEEIAMLNSLLFFFLFDSW